MNLCSKERVRVARLSMKLREVNNLMFEAFTWCLSREGHEYWHAQAAHFYKLAEVLDGRLDDETE